MHHIISCFFKWKWYCDHKSWPIWKQMTRYSSVWPNKSTPMWPVWWKMETPPQNLSNVICFGGFIEYPWPHNQSELSTCVTDWLSISLWVIVLSVSSLQNNSPENISVLHHCVYSCIQSILTHKIAALRHCYGNILMSLKLCHKGKSLIELCYST